MSKKVLVVDDSDTDAYSVSKILEEAGHVVIRAVDGLDGVAKARAEQPNLIIMDVVMPKLDGFLATRKITKGEDTKHIPVIMVTTKNQKTDEIFAKKQGAKGYINKPINKDEILSMINEFII